jgi:probable phosphoglycerate mutase
VKQDQKQEQITEENLNNRYFLLRHGRSLANEKGIILSNIRDGAEGWGLAEGSASEIRNSISGSTLPSDTVIFSSPFKRAFETALAAAEILECGEPQISDSLRERYFGAFDLGPDIRYKEVWTEDALNADNTKQGVESPSEVLRRIVNFLLETDRRYQRRTILFVSHGDPLNILLAASSGLGLTRHMETDTMKTAELRYLFS